MARLRIYLHGKFVKELPLNENQSYTGGRESHCDIVLDAEKSISRQHFRLEYKDPFWYLENISKYGEVFIENESVSSIKFESDISFIISSYSFSFFFEDEHDDRDHNEKSLVIKHPESHAPVPFVSEQQEDDFANNEFQGDNEGTFVGSVQLIPHLRFVNDQQITQKIIRLEGDTWVAGRDEHCHIHIDDKKVSRRQFEIRHINGQYLIRDLGSVNGTLVNNQRISSEQPYPLTSGSVISVLNHHMYFEIKDESFSEKIETIHPSLLLQPYSSQPQQALTSAASSSQSSEFPITDNQALPLSIPPITFSDLNPKKWDSLRLEQRLQQFDLRQHRFRLVLITLIVFILIGSLFTPPPEEKKEATQIVTNDPFTQLPLEKQELIKHSLQLANNLYMQAKYELAAAEIRKIHDLIPQYENSKELEELSMQALDTIKKQELLERQAQQEAELHQKISNILFKCKNILQKIKSSSEIKACLSEAQQLDPENIEIQHLILEAQEKEAEYKRKQDERKKYHHKIVKGQNIFRQAKDLHQKGKFLSARKIYHRLLKSGLPDPSGLKVIARRKIASIEISISNKIRQIISDSEQAYQSGAFKKALKFLEQSSEVDPENKIILQKITSIKKDLEKKMQNLYQESVLEEALGKVDDALSGWEKIIEQDHETGKYYKKAYIKLKKYGRNP